MNTKLELENKIRRTISLIVIYLRQKVIFPGISFINFFDKIRRKLGEGRLLLEARKKRKIYTLGKILFFSLLSRLSEIGRGIGGHETTPFLLPLGFSPSLLFVFPKRVEELPDRATLGTIPYFLRHFPFLFLSSSFFLDHRGGENWRERRNWESISILLRCKGGACNDRI